jgi:hypothetical protein
MNHFSQLLYIHVDDDDVIRTEEPHESEVCVFEFDFTIDKLKSHKSPGIDQICTSRTVNCEIHKLICIWH